MKFFDIYDLRIMKYIIGPFISELVERTTFSYNIDKIDETQKDLWFDSRKQNFYIDAIIILLSDLETPTIEELK